MIRVLSRFLNSLRTGPVPVVTCYHPAMIQPSRFPMIDELLDPVSRCLTQDVARSIASLRAASDVQHKLDDFAEKSTEGTLTAEERGEYEACVRAINFISILQMKAHAAINGTQG